MMVLQARQAAELKDSIAAKKAAESEHQRLLEIKQKEAEREATHKAFTEQTARIALEQQREVEHRRQEMERRDLER